MPKYCAKFEFKWQNIVWRQQQKHGLPPFSSLLKVDKPVYPNHAQLYNLLYLMFYIDYSLDLV